MDETDGCYVSRPDYTRVFRHIFRSQNSYDKGEMPPVCNGRPSRLDPAESPAGGGGLNRLGAVRRRDTCYPAAETSGEGGRWPTQIYDGEPSPLSGHRPFSHKVPRCLWKLSLLKYTVFNKCYSLLRGYFFPLSRVKILSLLRP